MTTYGFDQQLTVGESGEGKLDSHFGEWFTIRHATRDEQRAGIDRIYIRKSNARDLYRVEYKTDHTAGRTGNAFVETISVDTANKPGWAWHSQADLLLYYVPTDELVYVIRFCELRRQLDSWAKRYPVRKIPNQGYHTHGLLVPLDEFERIADQVITF